MCVWHLKCVMWCDVYYVYAENSDYTIQNLKCELLDFRCGNNLTLCASRMNVCVQCFFLLFVFQWLQQLHGPKWPNTTRANSFSADDLNRFHSLYLHVLHVRLCSIFGGFFGSRQNLKWKTSNNLIRLMRFCLATIFTLTSDTLNCWVISPVSKMAIEQRIHSNRCVSRSHVAAMVNDIY